MFVHGCFWHGHWNCRKTKGGTHWRVPASNRSYWADKIKANRGRDRRKSLQLRELGLRVLVVWECELRDRDHVRAKLGEFVDPHSGVGRIGAWARTDR